MSGLTAAYNQKREFQLHSTKCEFFTLVYNARTNTTHHCGVSRFKHRGSVEYVVSLERSKKALVDLSLYGNTENVKFVLVKFPTQNGMHVSQIWKRTKNICFAGHNYDHIFLVYVNFQSLFQSLHCPS